MINRYGDWMDTNLAVPLGPNKTCIIFDYFHITSPENVETSLKASDKVQKEDMEICDMVQEGLNSGVYIQGVYAPQFEKPMYHFHKLLKASFLK
jgi:choline monooxygenase